MTDIRQSIISSVFSRRNATGTLEETYVSHLKIWEDAGPEGRKARYILLSEASNGSGFLHKSKLNNNGSFSVGKTWRLTELRALQVVGPIVFNITLSRTYKWQTESQVDQNNFIIALIRLFRQITGGSAPLHLEGIVDPDDNDIEEDPYGGVRAASPVPRPEDSRSQRSQRPRTPQANERNGQPTRHTATPSNTTRDPVRSRDLPSRTRAPSDASLQPPAPLQPPASLQPRQRPSTASSTRPTQFPKTGLTPSRPTTGQAQAQEPNGHHEPNDTSGRRSRHDSQPTAAVVVDTQQQQQSISRLVPATLMPTRSRNASPDYHSRSRKTSATSRSQPGGGSYGEGSSTANTLRKDPNARVSYFDPGNQQVLERLLPGGAGKALNGNGRMGVDIEGGDEESAQDTLATVEEMLEGYEWASDDVIGRKMARGAADMIEARLLDELMALEKANIHSFLEADDRIALVMKYMDDALSELDNLDGLISSYKIHLNAVNDDISYIQSQNRGLQVQTQNQRALLKELENLLNTVHVDSETLLVLTQESLEKTPSIQRLEGAAAELYKALQAGRDTDMAATMERLQEYRTYNAQFCKRMYDFLSIMFTAQSKLLLGETDGLTKPGKGDKPTIIQHQDIEAYLGRYCGLMLYLKEMDEAVYGRLCAAYFSAVSELHSIQIKALLTVYLGYVKRTTDDDGDLAFTSPSASGSIKQPSGLRRAGTLIRSPIDNRNRDKEKLTDGDMRVSEVFGLILEQVIPLIYQENDFMVDFLQINDSALTFADYMGLDNYFRRQAARTNYLSQATTKLIRGSMELIFGFLPTELKAWLDKALEKDGIEIVGVLATLERSMKEAERNGNQFLVSLLGKQHTRLKAVFDRHIKDQLKFIEQFRLVSKKRRGLALFIKQFPAYVARVENQLIIPGSGAGGSEDVQTEVRSIVDMAYDRIVKAMFESLKLMAKMDGEDEDKGQLNYHIVIIENMHYIILELTKMDVGSIGSFTKKARTLYDESLNAYVKSIFRRPFGKIIDYFEGLERLLRTLSTPTDIATNPTYSKAALRKITKEYNAKDIRKHVDALFKRVEKHFVDSSSSAYASSLMSGGNAQDRSSIASDESVGRTVLLGVWRACEEELVKMTEGWKERIGQCYGESVGVGLEYSIGDVENAFRKQKTG